MLASGRQLSGNKSNKRAVLSFDVYFSLILLSQRAIFSFAAPKGSNRNSLFFTFMK